MASSESLSNLLTPWTTLETSLGAIARLKKFINATPKEIGPRLDTLVRLPPGWPSMGEVTWENVQAQYKVPGEDDLTFPVLHDFSFRVFSGQKVAICGRTGSGKSSLLATLLKTVDYTGTIHIDGLDIANISIKALRSSLNVRSQQPVLVPGTLRSNLILPSQEYAEPATRQTPTDQEIIDVLESLKVWGAIQQFGSLYTETENLPLFIGQQQLVCLARAILRKMESNILILDEAMSAVDGVTEVVMVEALEREFAAHTILSVVHRLNTVKTYDVLVVLDSGRIIDLGSPEDLVDGNGRLLRETAMT